MPKSKSARKSVRGMRAKKASRTVPPARNEDLIDQIQRHYEAAEGGDDTIEQALHSGEKSKSGQK